MYPLTKNLMLIPMSIAGNDLYTFGWALILPLLLNDVLGPQSHYLTKPV